MKIMFRAIDGELFESAEKCLEYERKTALAMIPRVVECFGEDGERCEPIESVYCVCNCDASDTESSLPKSAGRWVWFLDDWRPIAEVENVFSKMNKIGIDSQPSVAPYLN